MHVHYVCIYIYIYIYICIYTHYKFSAPVLNDNLPVAAKNALPQRRKHLGRWACGAPNQCVQSSFCSRIAGQRLA